MSLWYLVIILSHHAVLCLVAQPCSTLWDSMNCRPPGSSIRADSLGKNTGVGSHFLLQGIFPTPGIEPRSPSLRADSLLSEPTRKPKNIRVGSPSCLQGIFLTLESNWDLLHCRQEIFTSWDTRETHPFSLESVFIINIKIYSDLNNCTIRAFLFTLKCIILHISCLDCRCLCKKSFLYDKESIQDG